MKHCIRNAWALFITGILISALILTAPPVALAEEDDTASRRPYDEFLIGVDSDAPQTASPPQQPTDQKETPQPEHPGLTAKSTSTLTTSGKTKTLQLTTETSPKAGGKEAATGTIKWTSADSKIATITQKGTITALYPGKTTITATIDDLKATCAVTVAGHPITGIALKDTHLSIGEKKTLTPAITPKNATSKILQWTSSNRAIITVNQKGVATALKNGTATITAASGDGKIKGSCKVTAGAETTPAAAINKDLKLKAMQIGITFIKTGFTTVDGAKKYILQRATKKTGPWKTIKTWQTEKSGIQKTYKDTKKAFNTVYYYKIIAYRQNKNGNDIKTAAKIIACKDRAAGPNQSGARLRHLHKSKLGQSDRRNRLHHTPLRKEDRILSSRQRNHQNHQFHRQKPEAE